MNIRVLLSLVCILLSGCATSPSPGISGLKPAETGPAADKIWSDQLNQAPRGRENRAIVRAVRGDYASILSPTQSVPAKVGRAVTENQTLETGANSSVDLFLGDNGHVLRIPENSAVQFVRLRLYKTDVETTADTMLHLQKGRLLGNVQKMSDQSSYLVRTSSSVVKIRGAQFTVKVDGSIEIGSGTAQVFTDGKSFLVNSGETYIPGQGIRLMP